MVLLGVIEEEGWIRSQWRLTYPVGWEQICKGAFHVYDYYKNLEILSDGKPIEIENKNEIVSLDESGNLTIRGISTVVKTPIMITFHNQLQVVDVMVPCMTDEFKGTNYQKFNLSLGQYMDSIEFGMYR